MSRQVITKQVEAVVCEFCTKEIDTTSSDYCYHHIQHSAAEPINHHKYKTWHLLFTWARPKAGKVDAEYVRYDFHASCFDKLMRKFLAGRKEAK